MFNNLEMTVEYTDGKFSTFNIYPEDILANLTSMNDEIDKLLDNIAKGKDFYSNLDKINELKRKIDDMNAMKLIRNIKTKMLGPVTPIAPVVPVSAPVAAPPPPPPVVSTKTLSPSTKTVEEFINEITDPTIMENYSWLTKISAFKPNFVTDILKTKITTTDDAVNNLGAILNNKTDVLSGDGAVKLESGSVVLDDSTYELRPFDTAFKTAFNTALSVLTQPISAILKNAYFDMLGLGGVIVKYFDDSGATVPQEIFVSNTTSVFVKEQPDNSICATAIKSDESKFYGPFKRVFGPKGDESSNKAFYDFLVTGYGMLDDIAKGKDFRLYAFGFSGSGKTYTFITGASANPAKGLPADPPVLVHLIANIKNGTLQADGKAFRFEGTADGEGDNDGLSYQAFYPLEHNNLPSLDKFNDVSPPKGIRLPSGSSLEEMTLQLQQELVDVDKALRNKLYVVPTTNNPNSSRAFTLYKIKFHVGSEQRSIIFTDMPGNEKTTLIKTDFLFTPEVIKQQIEILQNKKNQIKTNFEWNWEKIERYTTAYSPQFRNDLKTRINDGSLDKTGAFTVHYREKTTKTIDKTTGKEQTTVTRFDSTNPSVGRSEIEIGFTLDPSAFKDGIINQFTKQVLGYNFKNLFTRVGKFREQGIEGLTAIDKYLQINNQEPIWASYLSDTILDFIVFYNMKSSLEPNVLYILPEKNDFMIGKPTEEASGFSFVRDFSIALQTKLLKGLELKDAEEFSSTPDPAPYGKDVIKKVLEQVFDPRDEIKKGRPELFKINEMVDAIYKTKPETIRNTLKYQFNMGLGKTPITNIRDFGSPIIHTLLALSTLMVDDTQTDSTPSTVGAKGRTIAGDKIPGMWKISDASELRRMHLDRSFVLSLFCYRVIAYILKQGNAINTALENHKFYFLKLAGNFGPGYTGSLMNGRMKSDTEGENFVIDETAEGAVQWNPPPANQAARVNLRPVNKALKFMNDKFKIQVSTSALDSSGNMIYFEENIDRTYMPIFNQILYTGPIAPSDVYSPDQEKAEKALTLVAIKRKLGPSKETQQGARCKFAIESLRFAEQISNEPKPDAANIPTMSTYQSLGYNKKYYSKYLKYKNKYMHLKNNL